MVDVEKYLQEKKIEFRKFQHPAVFTCEQAEGYNKGVKGIHSKNLFLKNKNSTRFYLVIMPANRKLDLKSLGEKIRENLKFANEKDLKEIFGVETGAVSPFGLINDKDSKVIVLIDKQIWGSAYVSFHPNMNTETFELTKENFHKYLSSLQNEVHQI